MAGMDNAVEVCQVCCGYGCVYCIVGMDNVVQVCVVVDVCTV